MNTAMVPYTAPQQDDETPAKMEKLRQLSEAIARAYVEMVKRKDRSAACAWANLVAQRVALRKTLPMLRVVS